MCCMYINDMYLFELYMFLYKRFSSKQLEILSFDFFIINVHMEVDCILTLELHGVSMIVMDFE